MHSAIAIRSNESVPMIANGVAFGDPTTRFSESIHHVSTSLEQRLTEELIRDGRTSFDAVTREFALYQLLAREGSRCIDTLEAAAHEDPNTDVRINVLWALEWLDSARCREIGLSLLDDPDHRVREWARVFAWEMGWSPKDFRYKREFKHLQGRTFDQTIYLHIMCNLYIRMSEDNKTWGHVLLSPQTLARVYGQALACPIFKTREKEIVISKTLSGLHADDSDHYEAFLFRGFTERTGTDSGNFYFETQTERPFFLSGRANDVSEGYVEKMMVPFAREGQWFLNDHVTIEDVHPIEYVRGLFQGWAYVNLDRIQRTGGEFLFPGNSVLSTLHHPIVGEKTNAFLIGRFKGKVLDWDGDGVLDLNYLPSYATAKGEVDSDLDGVPDQPGLTVSLNPAR